MSENFWDDVGGTGLLKAGFLGFDGSGKTRTATLLAVAAREALKLAGPIAFFDTETGSTYVADLVQKLTGKALLPKRSRSFADLLQWGRLCVEHGVSVGIVDSITHPWRELCDSYLVELNKERAEAGWSPRKKLEFEDWNVIKPKWQEWTDFYLNAPISIIICGRAGWEYEMAATEEGKRELQKIGTKMKTEGEFGFEPSLSVEMETVQILAKGKPQLVRRATVFKDRFAVLDAQVADFPSLDGKGKAIDVKAAYKNVQGFFAPHLAKLTPGEHPTVNTGARTEFGLDVEGEASWTREKKTRTILVEEIEAELELAFPGQAATAKKARLQLTKDCFGTGSSTQLANTKSSLLRDGLAKLRGEIARAKAAEKAVPAEGAA